VAFRHDESALDQLGAFEARNVRNEGWLNDILQQHILDHSFLLHGRTVLILSHLIQELTVFHFDLLVLLKGAHVLGHVLHIDIHVLVHVYLSLTKLVPQVLIPCILIEFPTCHGRPALGETFELAGLVEPEALNHNKQGVSLLWVIIEHLSDPQLLLLALKVIERVRIQPFQDFWDTGNSLTVLSEVHHVDQEKDS